MTKNRVIKPPLSADDQVITAKGETLVHKSCQQVRKRNMKTWTNFQPPIIKQ
jgi:hypothetical protein